MVLEDTEPVTVKTTAFTKKLVVSPKGSAVIKPNLVTISSPHSPKKPRSSLIQGSTWLGINGDKYGKPSSVQSVKVPFERRFM